MQSPGIHINIVLYKFCTTSKSARFLEVVDKNLALIKYSYASGLICFSVSNIFFNESGIPTFKESNSLYNTLPLISCITSLFPSQVSTHKLEVSLTFFNSTF